MKNLLNPYTFMIIKNLDFAERLNITISTNESNYLITLLVANIFGYLVIAFFIWLVLYLYFNLLSREFRN